MSEFTQEEIEKRKKAVFEAMSPRRQKFILKRGYDQWDPFQEPKDPIDIRRDRRSRRTVHMLVEEFLRDRGGEQPSNAYRGGVLEIAMGIVNRDDRYRGMYEFSCWYRKLLKSEGRE